MKKKFVTLILILGMLISAGGIAYSGWGPSTYDFGPIVIDAHPWGEEPHTPSSPYAPSSYRPGSGGGLPNLDNYPVFTNFVVRFYINYVIKHVRVGQSSVTQNRKKD
jgi:hypothetical protein